ncbi:MAG: hypothetical protein COT17_07970 [Elusimicrobia bacterium CG08_land_8_20_14_0_20_51_18]|nr:MAG: hypothetical protein COT17_07970 [Elusimicrobia bacterium CG08_land_8_20_14_0_20_51_18]
MEKTKPGNNVYSSFIFLKLNERFRHLVSNEKIAAKQEFENMIAGCQERVFLRTYFTTGLKKRCDLLFWRMSDNLDYLQDICAKTFSTGIGKYLETTHSYLGVHQLGETANRKDMELGFVPKNTFGVYKYMLIHPLIKSQTWYEMSPYERESLKKEREAVLTRYGNINENFFTSYGIDDQDMIVSREAKSLEDLIKVTKELKRQRIKNYTVEDRPVFLCIGRDLREILDNLS